MTDNLLILIRKFCKALLQHLPDFKGIETSLITLVLYKWSLQHLPDFKGIETSSVSRMSAWEPLQHLPDFKGIETVAAPCIRALRACSTSLTSNGYTFQTHKKRPVTFTGRFFVVWFQKLFLLGFTSICSWWHLFSNPIDCCNTTIHRLGNFFFGHVIACQ